MQRKETNPYHPSLGLQLLKKKIIDKNTYFKQERRGRWASYIPIKKKGIFLTSCVECLHSKQRF
jgi:hypothetical protein